MEEIRSRINIVDLISEYIRVQKAGASWKALCPFHHEKTPSFIISEEKQIWHCFGCGKGGDIFGFLMEMESLEFKEALKILAGKAGVILSKNKFDNSENKTKILEILELATKFYEKQLWEGMGRKKILPYFEKRGLKEGIIREFRVGYAPLGWRNLLEFLTGRGYSVQDIFKSGLLVNKSSQILDTSHELSNSLIQGGQATNYYDRFRDRIMFPIADIMGHIIGFSGRVSPGGDESSAKYVNTPETSVYHKSSVLYGIDKAKKEIKDKKFTLLVEGNIDVIASHQAGIRNTVAVSGTALTPSQLDIIKRYAGKIKMLYDMDSAGQEASLRGAFLCFQRGMDVDIVKLSGGKDASEAVEKNPQSLIDSVNSSIPAMEHLIGTILEKHGKEKAENKKVIVSEFLDIIQNFSNPVEKEYWIRDFSQKTGIEEKNIIDLANASDFKKRKNPAFEESEAEGNSTPKESKKEAIKRKIAGLIIASPILWKKIIADFPESSILESEAIRMILAKGKESGFEFQKFLLELGEPKLKDYFQKTYFDAKYQKQNNGKISEREEDEIKFLFETYFQELKKEIRKEKMVTILQDMRKAEASGDSDSLKMLIEEFSKISKE